MRVVLVLALTVAAFWPSFASADESDFLKSLEGKWSGDGMVLLRIGGPPISVSCDLATNAEATNLSMQGSCRGLLVIRRSISANISASERGYSGNYIGPSGQPSVLSGN